MRDLDLYIPEYQEYSNLSGLFFLQTSDKFKSVICCKIVFLDFFFYEYHIL